MSEAEKLDLIFHPGLSTANQVTAISGRGVGMDVVRANVERIGGVIALDNRPGCGLTITLRVPLTLTIIPGLIVRSEEHTSELQSLMRTSYAVFCLKQKNTTLNT